MLPQVQEAPLTNKDKLITVAVDAMGGDYAPTEIVAGAVEAAGAEDVQVLLVGDENIVRSELNKHDIDGLPITLIPSEGVILENDHPALALRQKPKASILVSTGLVKQGKANASVSMGSTGAAMAASAIILGLMEGVERPAVGGPIIGLSPNTIILDVGSNVDCRPAQMLSFAVTGEVFARQYWHLENPRIAILSVGSEEGKGNRLVKETSELLVKSGMNFVGNIEANDLPYDKAEVVICDGFVGNVVMKLIEGLGGALGNYIREKMGDRLPSSELESLITDIYEISNVAEMHGGGPLLGVNGVSIVGHGKAKSAAVRRAVTTAKEVFESGFVSMLQEELATVRKKVYQ